MSAYNVVRMKVKKGMEQKFLDAHKKMAKELPALTGAEHLAMIKTGDRTYCLIGRWRNFDDIVAARPKMVGTLDDFRSLLEDLGGGLGVTDPVSGPTVFEHTAKGK